MDKAALKALLMDARAGIPPEDHGFTRPTAQGRRAQGLTQDQVDILLHRARGTYARLESGRYDNPPEDFLRDIAELLNLSEQEWTSLCLYSRHRGPTGPLRPTAGLQVSPVWGGVVESIGTQNTAGGNRTMAYVTDQQYNVVTYNDAFADLFPRREVPPNTMEWMLLNVESRTVLADWKRAWAPLVCPQLRAARAAIPDDPKLAQLERRVLADPDAGPVYQGMGDTYTHPDGAERPINHAQLGPGWVELAAAEPLGSPRARLMIVAYRQGAGPRPPARPPLTAASRRRTPRPAAPPAEERHDRCSDDA